MFVNEHIKIWLTPTFIPFIGINMALGIDKSSNHLLAALPEAEWQRWLPQMELVNLKLGQVLYESGGTMQHVYFPIDAIVSLLFVLENGASAEIAVVGNEGIVGVSLFMGGETTPSRAVVQSAGKCLRLSAYKLKKEFTNSLPVMHLLLRYTQALITQMTQTAVCNRHHSLDQQLCRWLLLSMDRLTGSHLVMTQELIANMLGVRREGVTEAAGRLQKAGLISYAFLKLRRPLASATRVEDAPFRSLGQRHFLKEQMASDADWAELIDRLSLALRHD
jgi:CRP-like cAMP-binding protein